MGGVTAVTLLQSEIPAHNHNAVVNTFDSGDANVATGNALAKSSNASVYNTATSPVAVMSDKTLMLVGNNLPHNNMQPYLTLNFCIALQGVYPPRG
jgi:microcystin-dependent protein